MKLPRDIDGLRLAKALSDLGYEATHQNGFHIRVSTEFDGENHEVIPYHEPIKTGTLASILKRVAAHHRMTVERLLEILDL
jgi:predicted RNA binding protein YcfA (HicA-like mRNA interferase family)